MCVLTLCVRGVGLLELGGDAFQLFANTQVVRSHVWWTALRKGWALPVVVAPAQGCVPHDSWRHMISYPNKNTQQPIVYLPNGRLSLELQRLYGAVEKAQSTNFLSLVYCLAPQPQLLMRLLKVA